MTLLTVIQASKPKPKNSDLTSIFQPLQAHIKHGGVDMISKFFWKAFLNGILVVPFLLVFTEASLTQALIAALTLSIVAYVIGDQMILRLMNNGIATVADVGLSFAFLWMAASFMDWSLSFMEMAIMSVAVGVIEYFIHGYFLQDEGRVAR
jgi:hypothetical protein